MTESAGGVSCVDGERCVCGEEEDGEGGDSSVGCVGEDKGDRGEGRGWGGAGAWSACDSDVSEECEER